MSSRRPCLGLLLSAGLAGGCGQVCSGRAGIRCEPLTQSRGPLRLCLRRRAGFVRHMGESWRRGQWQVQGARQALDSVGGDSGWLTERFRVPLWTSRLTRNWLT